MTRAEWLVQKRMLEHDIGTHAAWAAEAENESARFAKRANETKAQVLALRQRLAAIMEQEPAQ